ncbi:hypothetical protein SAMN04487989_101620 [Bizionia echini]|uniref:O-antigen ligase like membrane protein n=2 Tax=Bizionia echini TaxID=649333 RepID=A0A1I4Z8K9_9FLAO|nr:hypothetical protein SAMN04487989_101620 [Bizionia echini]
MLKRTYVNNFIILLPIILIFIGEIVAFTHPSISPILKVVSCFILLFPIWLKVKFPTKLIFLFLVFFVFFIYAFIISFNIKAAIEEGIRYFFPIAILLYGYYNKDKLDLFINFIIAFAIINIVYQLSNYYDFYVLNVEKQWFYQEFYAEKIGKFFYWPATTNGILRATGLVGFFGAFGILNFMAYWYTKLYYFGKRRTLFLYILFVGVFLSTSFKTIGFFIVTLLVEYRKKLKYLLIVPFVLIILFITAGSTLRKSILDSVSVRLELYVTERNSARSESYRVMFDEFKSFNFFGEGIGSFGGPASTKYDSPFYEKVDFNWYGLESLVTTDTFYPHLFVEMGILGALSYLLLLLGPLLLHRKIHIKKLKALLLIYGMLFFDSLFSYSLNNLAMLSVTLLFVYPIIYYSKENVL